MFSSRTNHVLVSAQKGSGDSSPAWKRSRITRRGHITLSAFGLMSARELHRSVALTGSPDLGRIYVEFVEETSMGLSQLCRESALTFLSVPKCLLEGLEL